MRIFQDLFTEVEIISDSYPWVKPVEGQDSIVEVQSRMVVVGDVNVDVGCGNAFGGKNEDEEEQGGAGGAPVQKVNDLIDAFGYEESTVEKNQWQQGFKVFCANILKKKTESNATPEQIAAFKAGAGAYLKYLSGKWKDLTAYTPKGYDRENSWIFSYWKNEEDEAPVFIFWLDGMKSYKV